MSCVPEQFHFVLAHAHHGATALAHLLNNHREVSCLGDTTPRSEYDQNCACGVKVSACHFWQYIDDRFATYRLQPPYKMYPVSPVLLRRRGINDAIVRGISIAALCTNNRIWRIAGKSADRYTRFYLDFIAAVKDYNRTSVYVSGQKSLLQVAAVKSILPKAEINVVHLVRDPRGFACSQRRLMPERTVDASARHWKKFHHRLLRVVRPLTRANYLLVRYEDLCREPESTMRRIFAFIGVEYQDTFFPPAINHTIGSRAARTFSGQLRESTKWRDVLSHGEQVRCLQLTSPLSTKFGYVADEDLLATWNL